jgi:hypothetical protein
MSPILYWSIFSGAVIATSFILVILFVIIAVIFSIEVENKAIVLLCLLMATLCSPAAYYSLYALGLNVPEKDITTEQLSEDNQILSDSVSNLQLLLNEPENIRLADLPEITTEITALAHSVQVQSDKQSDLIDHLKTEIIVERKKADEAKSVVEALKKLTSEEINAVNWLITADAKEQARISFWQNAFTSFCLGVITSLIATGIYKLFGKKLTSQASHALNTKVEEHHKT